MNKLVKLLFGFVCGSIAGVILGGLLFLIIAEGLQFDLSMIVFAYFTRIGCVVGAVIGSIVANNTV